MAPRVAIAFLALIAFLSCSETYAQTNYMFLYLRWPGGVCPQKGDCCFSSSYSRTNDFTVQNLAMSFNNDSSCSNVPFDPNAIQNIMASLNQYWPSFRCQNMVDWEQVWNDNGRCTGLTVNGYFSRGLALRQRANLLDNLARRGIRPSSTATYPLINVVNAINEGLGVANTTVLHCGSNKLERIMTVRLCVDVTATYFIPCPTQRNSTCPANVKLDLLPPAASLEMEENPIEMVVAQ